MFGTGSRLNWVAGRLTPRTLPLACLLCLPILTCWPFWSGCRFSLLTVEIAEPRTETPNGNGSGPSSGPRPGAASRGAEHTGVYDEEDTPLDFWVRATQ